MSPLSNVKENVSLAPYTTFKIGGPALYFMEAITENDFAEGINWASRNFCPYFILGGGSNILVSDRGFPGLVIKNELSFIIGPKGNVLEAGAGNFFSSVIMTAVNAGLEGLEWGIGIPGTLGGAICGNAGAFGRSTGEAVREVKALEEDGRIMTYKNRNCRFGYRDSIFKRQSSIILSAKLEFNSRGAPAVREKMQEYLKNRPPSPPFPSAGCAFKNIEFRNLSSDWQKLIPAEKVKGGKVPAGFLIEQCGLMGRQIGGAKVWETHCNYIVNTGEAAANDVTELIHMCKHLVKDKFGVTLEEEIRYVGF